MPLDQMDIDNYDPTSQQEQGEKEMSFLDHLEELRWHLIRAVIAIIVVSIALFIFKDFVFDHVVYGPRQESFLTYKVFCNISHAIGMGDKLCMKPIEFVVQGLELGENFIMHIKITFILGFIVAFPYIFWEIWRFLKPGLYTEEVNATRGIVFVCSILFGMGVLFGYYIITPFAMNFLAGYDLGTAEDVKITKLSSYINYLTMFILPAGVIFELPMVVLLLTKLGLLTPQLMKTYRKHAIVGILILASIITPPDVVTQFLIGIPLYILYEISISVSAITLKKEAA